MRGADFPPDGAMRPQAGEVSWFDAAAGAERRRGAVPEDRRSAQRSGLAWVDGFVPSPRLARPRTRPFDRGRERSDGAPPGTARSSQSHGGLRFDQEVRPGGYAWWYVDALSEDGREGLTLIAFVGSVFSPYYAWSGRRDPANHCALNVALYGTKKRWAMTERGRDALKRDDGLLNIGPSAVRWDGHALTIDIDEVTAPIPSRLRGQVRLYPEAVVNHPIVLDEVGNHCWWPIAPCARVEVDLERPKLRWSGTGYFDSNRGDASLESTFRRWDWSRAATPDGTAVLYDLETRGGETCSLAILFDPERGVVDFTPPPPATLPKTLWRMGRGTRADAPGGATVLKTLEDGPFYARSILQTTLLGHRAEAVHESLSLDRFRSPILQTFLPWRMPRRFV